MHFSPLASPQSHTFDEQTVGVSLHPGGYQLIVVLSSRLCVHAVAAQELSLLRDIPLRGCSCASFSPSGALFAAQTGSAVVLFDSLSCASLAVLRGPAARLSCLHWSFDGGALASGGADGALSAWSALSGQRIRDHSAKSQPLAALAHVAPGQEDGKASAAGEALVSAGIAGLLRGFVPGTSGGLIPVATLDLRTPAHSLLSNPFDASQSSLQSLASSLVDSLGLSCAALSADGQTAFAAGTHGRISVVAPGARLLPWTRLVLVPEAELEERRQREEQLEQALEGGARELAYQLGVRDAAHDAQTQVIKAASAQQCQVAAARCKELEEQLRTLQSSSEEKLIAVQAECQSRLVLMLSSSHDRAETDRVQRERLEADMNEQRQRHADVLKSAEEKAYELRGSNGVLQRQCEILEQRAEDVQKARDAAQQALENLGKVVDELVRG
ncbi:hypothetical protein H632_c176p0 [Helicosporidium sp. ATCC 50920]|nr:hypothetical protein H632_c176p0 [Helicosporidium sp. ATCC 50920]|eukprot:KDD76576.1 hypothetical protein H632_c176p0 [Helicosporidium sp. ATCC 50920]